MAEFSVGSPPPRNFPQTLPKNLYRYGEISLYSTHAFGSAAGASIANSTNRLFVTQLGGQGQGFSTSLTISETNLKEASRVPNGQAYDVFGVAGQVMGWNPTTDAISAPVTDASTGLATIVNNGILAWDFTQTKVYICPLMLAGAGGGLFGAVADSTGVQVGALNNGNGGIFRYLKSPVALPGASTFSVELNFGSRAAALAANAGFAVRIVLIGYYKSVIEIG